MNKIGKKGIARKGQAIVELCGNVIIFTIMVALMTTLSSVLYMQHILVTAAREGARAASLSEDFANDDDAAGIAAVQQRVKDMILQTAGQTLDGSNSTIDVTPPDAADPYGSRTVTVDITYTMENPIPIAGFIEGLSGGDYSALQSLPMNATATMRFEE